MKIRLAFKNGLRERGDIVGQKSAIDCRTIPRERDDFLRR
jgi:hypothetical protein